MTIMVPGAFENIDFSNFTKAFKTLKDRDWKRKEDLRQALLAGRISQQELVDMGDEAVTKAFGFKKPESSKEFTSGKQSAKSILNQYTGAQLQEIMSLPETDPRKIEFKSKLSGVNTPTERKIQENQANQGAQNLEKGKKELTSSELTIQAQQRKAQEDQRALEADAVRRTTANRAIMRIGGKDNLYSSYRATVDGVGLDGQPTKQGQTLTPEEIAALQTDDEYKTSFETQRQDYWKQKELDLTKQRLDENKDPKKLQAEYDAMNARKIADQSNMSNVADIMMVLKDRRLEDPKFNKVAGEKERPKGAAAGAQWDAIQAIQLSRKMESDDRKKTAMESFNRQTAGIAATLRQPDKLQEKDAQAQVDLYNDRARSILGSYIPASEIPQLAFDKKGPRGKGWIFDDRTIYLTQGTDPALDVGAVDPLESWKGKSKEDIDKALTKMSINDRAETLKQLTQRGWYK